MTISKGKKALLHVAKAKTGMSDDEYRALLSSEGLASAADPGFTGAKFDRIMERFKKDYGFVSNRTKPYRPPKSKDALIGKITAIRTELGLTESYVDAICQNMFGIASYRWLDTRQLHSVVAALSYHQTRKRKAQGSKAYR
jgi:AraC-like DNA-binding protein